MTIQEKLIPKNQYNRPGKVSVPRRICIHYTGSPGTSATTLRAYYGNVAKGYWPDNPSACTSAQYIIGISGEVIRVVPDAEVAYAASGKNDGTIHIEVCHKYASGAFSAAAVSSLVELVQGLMDKYKIGVTSVVRHYDLTGKACPLWYVKHSADWDALRARILRREPAVGDKVIITAPYASSTYATSGTATAAIGKTRYITQIYPSANFPYRIGISPSDTSTKNTSGFAKIDGFKVI